MVRVVLLALSLFATISPHGMVFAEVVGHNDKHEQLAVYARLASVERKHKEQIEALGRRFDEQDAELRKQDAELQDLRRQVATGPEASGRRLQEKGGKKSKSDKANGPGASLGLTAEEIQRLKDFLARNGTDVDPKFEALANCTVVSSEPNEVIIQGCDFIVRGNGDATYVDPIPAEAKGNLIVGWNEGDGGDKTGLNNLVVGSEHTYTSTGGAVFGQKNTISAASATVTGGYQNTAIVDYGSVTGGQYNKASGLFASVSGGQGNEASFDYASVSGGYENTASGVFASVSGGEENKAIGDYASVSGGSGNTAGGKFSSVSGGSSNNAIVLAASVSGGQGNVASGLFASVSGGTINKASNIFASVSGGDSNTASGDTASVSGGKNNEASGVFASVSGGQGNYATADYALLPLDLFLNP